MVVINGDCRRDGVGKGSRRSCRAMKAGSFDDDG